MDKLLREFLGEAEQLVDTVGADLQTLRARHDDGRTRRDLVSRIFRHVHTLKGSSAALELISVTEITHEFETLLDSLRLGRTTLNDRILDIFDETIGVVSNLLRAIADGGKYGVPSSLAGRLRGLAQGNDVPITSTGGNSSVLAALPDEIAGVLSEQEIQRLSESVNEGLSAFLVEANFALATFDTDFKELSETLGQSGEIISTHPGIAPDAEDKISFRVVYSTSDTSSQLGAKLSHIGQVAINELDSAAANKSNADFSEDSTSPESGHSSQASIAPMTTLMRIDVAELDALIKSTHDLFIDTMAALDDAPSSTSDRKDEIRREFEELEKDLLQLRKVPLANIFDRATRAGHVAARHAGKEIEFVSEGGDTLLDKPLSDVLADPLLHLLRNAVDHGIEPRDERASTGKNARGRITLKAWNESGQVRIRISDDGRGIDPSRVAQAAFERGVLANQSELSADECIRLIFTPGFSTAEYVSEISGRGVGLDIVDRAVTSAGGTIVVQSKTGVGTMFELQMPST